MRLAYQAVDFTLSKFDQSKDLLPERGFQTNDVAVPRSNQYSRTKVGDVQFLTYLQQSLGYVALLRENDAFGFR